MRRPIPVLVLYLTAATLAGTASAETITVCAKGCDYTSINAAIAVASDGDVIQLSAETYFEGEQIDTLGKAITLRGVLGKDGEPTSVLDGDGTHRGLVCLEGEGSDTIIENLQIRNSVADGEFPFNRGGGCYLGASGPLFRNCHFHGNSASTGGAVFCDSECTPTFIDCTFTENDGGNSTGALFLDDSGSLKMIRCVFQENSSSIFAGALTVQRGSDGERPTVCLRECVFEMNESVLGGAAILGSCDVDLSGCSFISNISVSSSFPSRGGGLYLIDASGTIANCHFIHNEAQDGGAAHFEGSSQIAFRDCVFEENLARGSAGAVYCYDGLQDFEDCVFLKNEAISGGAIDGYYGSHTFSNCAFRENGTTGGAGGAIYCSFEFSPIIDGCHFQSNSAHTRGGAIHGSGSSRPVLLNTTFSMNTSEDSGDDISFRGGNGQPNGMPTIGECVFEACCSIDPPMGYLDEGGNLFADQEHVACDSCRSNIDCGNDTVDAEDLGLILAAWGSSDKQCDIDGNGMVDAGDLGLLIAAWGPCS